MHSNFAPLKQLTVDNRNEKRLRRCIIFLRECHIRFYGILLNDYNITWRGLTALLILELGQCEGQNAGMGGSRYSHAFFVSISERNVIIKS